MTDLAFLAAHAAVRLGADDVHCAPVAPGATLPLCVTPRSAELATSPEMFVAWYRSRLDTIDTLLDACGALLWRGFAVPDTAAFGRLGALYPAHANGYTAGATQADRRPGL